MLCLLKCAPDELQIPTDPEQLPWALPRFLELAGRRGPCIIILGGLHRLRSSSSSSGSSSEAARGLQWLPLRTPPNVRLIVAATTPVGAHLLLKPPLLQVHACAGFAVQ